jgi:integrase
MARIFRVARATIDKTTGKRRRLRDEKGKFIYLPYWYGQYVSWDGRRKTVALSINKAEAQRMVDQLQQREIEIRLGLRPIPTAQQKTASLPIVDIVAEYIAWGGAQGGRGGRGWSETHVQDHRRYLKEWQKELSLKSVSDLSGILPKVEKVIRTKLAKGFAGKTITNCVGSLSAFCSWAKTRKYIIEDPLLGLAKIDKTPQSRRRLITADEIARLLAVAPPDRRLLYEVALKSGLRVNELRSLTVDHLDVARGGLLLDAEWTKNRKPGFQPLPRDLVERLKECAATGWANIAYTDRFTRGGHEPTWNERALLYVPRSASLGLDRDCKTAGIAKQTSAGKLDFHSLRVAYINMVLTTSGVDVKTAQVLARHSTPDLTMNVYGRAQEDRLADVVERMGKDMLGRQATQE